MPRAFRVAADGSTTVNTDYFTSVELTSEEPAGRHLHHQPEGGLERRHPDHVGGHRLADPRDQRQGQGVRDRQPQRRRPRRIGDRGVDDRQAVVTFAKPYAEWRGMFAGNTMLLPKSMTANPRCSTRVSSTGPARPRDRSSSPSLDRTAQRITLTRNPKWWGNRRCWTASPTSCSTTPPASRPCRTTPSTPPGWPALDELTIARDTTGISIRRAPGPAGITSRSTARRARSWPTRRCGWRSPRASTGRPSPTSPSAASSTTRFR